MKKEFLSKCIALVMSLSFSSCQDKIGENLNSVENYIEQYPERALDVLDTLHYEIGLSPKNFNKLNLLTVIAKYKKGKSIEKDIAIFKSVDFYKQNGDLLSLTQASLYSGKVYQERSDDQNAMKYYLDAEELAKGLVKQNKLKGLIQSSIAELLYKEYYIDSAIVRYKSSLESFEVISDSSNIISVYNSIGICFCFVENKTDSAKYYFNKGLTLAELSKNKELITSCKQNLGFIYLQISELQKSINCFNESLHYAESQADSVLIFQNIMRVYISDLKFDSAQSYIKKIEGFNLDKIPENLNKSLFVLKSDILRANKKYEEALDLSDIFVEHLDSSYTKFMNTNILDTKEKYKIEVIKNKHNRILINRQYTIISLLVIIIISFILAAILIVKSRRNKKALITASNRISEFLEIVENYNAEKDALRRIVLDHFEILKKSALIENLIKSTEKVNGEKILIKFNQIIYGQSTLDWDILYNTMNQVYDGQLELVKNTYPSLNDIEFKICCLVFAKFSRTEISFLLGLSSSTISSRNSSIRKKMGIEEYGNIAEFIKNIKKQVS